MRNYVTYESLGIFISNYKKKAYATFGPEDIKWLSRIQSSDYGISLNRDILKQLGAEDFYIQELNIQNAENPPNSSPTDEAIEPTVAFNMSYLLTDGVNEKNLGLTVNKIGCDEPKSIASVLEKDQNIYVIFGPEHLDLLQRSSLGGNDLIELNNCYLSKYALNVAVGSFPTVSTSWVGSNVSIKEYSDENPNISGVINTSNPILPNGWDIEKSYLGTENPDQHTFELPDIFQREEPEIAALRPMDISLSIPNLNIGGQKLNKQRLSVDNFNVNIDISRKDLYGIGSNFAFDRKLDYPLKGSISLSVIIDDLEDGSLIKAFEKEQPYDIEITINDPCLDVEKQRVKLKIEHAIFTNKKVGKQIGSVSTLDIDFYFSVTSEHGFYLFADKSTDSQLFLKSKYEDIGGFDAEYFSNSGEQTTQQENFEDWLTNDGDPSLTVKNDSEVDLTVDLINKTILNPSLSQVGTIEYWFLDEKIDGSGSCLFVEDLALGEEIDTWAEVLLQFNDLDNYCANKQIVILYKYNDGTNVSDNFRIVDFNTIPGSQLSLLTFNQGSNEVGYNYQITDSLFDLSVFVFDIDIDSGLSNSLDVTFVIKSNGEEIHEFYVEDILNADLSQVEIPLLNPGDYILSLKNIHDCGDNSSLDTIGEINTEFFFSVVEYELILPTNLTFEAFTSDPEQQKNIPQATINKNGVFYKNIDPDTLTIGVKLDDEYTPEITNITWAESVLYQYSFSENADVTVKDTIPPELINIDSLDEALFNPENQPIVFFGDFINEAIFYDNSTSPDKIISFYIHEWDNGNKKEFIVIDPDSHLSVLEDNLGREYIRYDSLENAQLNKNGEPYYDYSTGQEVEQTFDSDNLALDSHKIFLYQLQDKAGNFAIFNYEIKVETTEIALPAIQDVYIEAGHGTEYTPESQNIEFTKGSNTFNISVDPKSFNDLDLINEITPPIIGELSSPDSYDNYTIIYDYEENDFEEQFSYKVTVGDKTPPEIRNISFSSEAVLELPNSPDFTFNDLNPVLDVYDLVSGYNLFFEFRICKGDFNSPTFLPASEKTHIIENTDNSEINLTDFELFDGITMQVNQQYSLILYSVEDQLGNKKLINSPYMGIKFKFENPNPISLSGDGEKIKLEPVYEKSSILFCYDSSWSMAMKKTIDMDFNPTKMWIPQINWIKNSLSTLKELDFNQETNLYQRIFDYCLVDFDSNGRVEENWRPISNYDSTKTADEFGEPYGGTQFYKAFTTNKNQFESLIYEPNAKKIIIFISDGDSPDGVSEAESIASDLYNNNIDSRIGRVITYPVLLTGADESSMLEVGRAGQGITDENVYPDHLDSRNSTLSVLDILNFIMPYNGLTNYDIHNTSNRYLHISLSALKLNNSFDLYEDGVLVDPSNVSNKLYDIKFQEQLTETNKINEVTLTEDSYIIPPNKTLQLYFTIIPSDQTFSQSEVYDPISTEMRFFNSLFAYTNNAFQSPDYSKPISFNPSSGVYNSAGEYLSYSQTLEIQQQD